MFKEDTIAAITTGMSNAGVGIIRISGDRACEITDMLFRAANKNKKAVNMKSYTAAFGGVYEDDRMIDEAILLVMKAPHTYTCEDVCELQCHGGIVVLRKILDLVIKCGARAAEPGEFTKRAFLGGRIDLSQAESVMVLGCEDDRTHSGFFSQGNDGIGMKESRVEPECRIAIPVTEDTGKRLYLFTISASDRFAFPHTAQFGVKSEMDKHGVFIMMPAFL